MKTLLKAGLSAAVLVAAGPVAAETAFGLRGDQIVSFSTNAPGATGVARTVTGLAPGEQLIGIDVRPRQGGLWGLGSQGGIYRLELSGSTFAAVSTGVVNTTLNGSNFEIDFNPLADRLRIVSDANQSLRVNVDNPAAPGEPGRAGTNIDGSFNYGPNGPTPAIVAAAYSNNVAFPASTNFFVLDASNDSLALVNPPNSGNLTIVGGLGLAFDSDDTLGFDISGRTGTAFLSFQDSLYTVDLGTGAASLVGQLGGAAGITDLTIGGVPEPTTWAFMIGGFGMVGAVLRRRRLVAA
jgi:hypothetical protein